MPASVRGFTLDAPRYDQDKYSGRVRHFFRAINPKYMVTSLRKLYEAKYLLKLYKEDRLPGSITADDLWGARELTEAILHPQTGEPIFAPFRMAAFVPMNIPIAATMMMLPQTIPTAIGAQWLNQTYNAGFNYGNRNATNEDSASTIFQSYLTACTISCSVAVGLGELVKRSSKLAPAARALVQRAVPWIAVTSAGVANAVIMRRSEATEGIFVTDSEGEVRGKSCTAGKLALAQVAITRGSISSICLLLPSVTLHYLGQTAFMKRNLHRKIPIELAVIGAYLGLALPAAVGLFPQTAAVPASWLEPSFQNLVNKQKLPVHTLYYNKGI